MAKQYERKAGIKMDKKYYIFMSKNLYSYIAIDAASGYPYYVKDFWRAKIWYSKKEAYEYYMHFKESQWTLKEITGFKFKED